MARLLMAYVFARAGEFPPVISTERRDDYIRNLEWADGGDLRRFVQYLADLAATTTLSALSIAEDVLDGETGERTATGGRRCGSRTVSGGISRPFLDLGRLRYASPVSGAGLFAAPVARILIGQRDGSWCSRYSRRETEPTIIDFVSHQFFGRAPKMMWARLSPARDSPVMPWKT